MWGGVGEGRRDPLALISSLSAPRIRFPLSPLFLLSLLLWRYLRQTRLLWEERGGWYSGRPVLSYASFPFFLVFPPCLDDRGSDLCSPPSSPPQKKRSARVRGRGGTGAGYPSWRPEVLSPPVCIYKPILLLPCGAVGERVFPTPPLARQTPAGRQAPRDARTLIHYSYTCVQGTWLPQRWSAH